MKRIVLCADDYGQAPAVSQGIISLVKYGRLSATSCLVNTDHWLEHASWLIPFKSLSVGLHLNLTQGKALSDAFIREYGENLPTLNALLGRSIVRCLKKEVIEAEFEAQIDRFVAGFGQLPDFVDGHQHVHQFPIIRDAFVAVYKRRLEKEAVYVRWVYEQPAWYDLKNNFKKFIILAVGSHAFKKQLQLHQIPHNETFAGIYPFGSEANHYRRWFIRFLQASEEGTLIMCHPGWASDDPADPIAAARYQEYCYLFGDQFLQDCYTYDVTLSDRSSFIA